MVSATPPPLSHDAARLRLRAHARALLAQPRDAQLHLARVDVALLLEGTEPVQGALADMFTQLDANHANIKRIAYLACCERLSPRVRMDFEQLLTLGPLPAINTLATRWSLLSIPTADIPARGRRCSLDDSRKLAQQGLQAFEAEDAEAQQAFLDHCMTCHDKMAFMLARRDVLKHVARLPSPWQAVSDRLEEL